MQIPFVFLFLFSLLSLHVWTYPIHGTPEEDVLLGTHEKDDIYGYKGNDLIRGYEEDDYMWGYEGDDRLYGGEGNDWLLGGEDEDRLFGGNGNDKLYGGNGDYFEGADSGDDLLVGGEGKDRYVFSKQGGHDIIEEEYGNDGDILYIRYPKSQATFVTSGSDKVITFLDGSSITIKNFRTRIIEVIEFEDGTRCNFDGISYGFCEDWDRCAKNPCQNEGLCSYGNNENGYLCSCPKEFYGVNCEYLSSLKVSQ